MKRIVFFDLNGTQVTVQHSSLATQAAFRVYLEGPTMPCIHLSLPQLKMLVSALEDISADAE